MDGEAFSETELDLMSDMLFSFYYGQITPIDRELKKLDDESRIL